MKASYGFSDYLIHLKSHKMRTIFTKLRLNERLIKNTRLAIESYYKCPMCNTNEIESVEHFILCCPRYDIHRDKLYTNLGIKSKIFNVLPPCDKMRVLLNLQLDLLSIKKVYEDCIIDEITSFIKSITLIRHTPLECS